jgi:hypothetical protein
LWSLIPKNKNPGRENHAFFCIISFAILDLRNSVNLLTQQLNSSFPAKGIGIFDRPQRSGESRT